MHESDPRRVLHRLLRAYAARHPQEAAVSDRFLAFVEAHDDCFERSLRIGHVTGSAWIVDAAGENVLLTHHRKLDIWVQLGGHADGDPDVHGVARREALEESGLPSVTALGSEVFDLDIHRIPARRDEPEHEHFDVRFAFRAPAGSRYRVSEESHDLAWVPVAGIERYTQETSMLRMARKWRARAQNAG